MAEDLAGLLAKLVAELDKQTKRIDQLQRELAALRTDVDALEDRR
jgi:cell division protein FtsB